MWIIREPEMCFYEAFFRSCVKGIVQRDLPPRAFLHFLVSQNRWMMLFLGTVNRSRIKINIFKTPCFATLSESILCCFSTKVNMFF